MSRKFSERRRKAFLTALAATGNQSLAAERVGVSRSWVGLQRGTDAAFDAAVRGAIAAARERLRWATSADPLTGPPLRAARSSPPAGGRGGNAPPSGWGFLDGAELVVRGSNGRRVQIGRARVGQWTGRVEARFLAALSATCNVKAACAEVGKAHSSAYAHRKRWRAFAEAWDAAIVEGYARIEVALIERGCNLFADPDEVAHLSFPAMTVGEAIHLLHMHKNIVHGAGKAPGLPPRRMRLVEVQASILRKIEAIERADAIPPQQRAADEAGYAARRWRGAGGG